MKNNKKSLSKEKLIGALVLVGVSSFVAYSVTNAFQGDYTKKGPNYSEKRHAIMEKAFNENDYNTWKAEMDKNSRNGQVIKVVNKENFAKFAEARKLGKAGDKAGANAIRAELGLKTSDGKRGEHGFGKSDGNRRGQNKGENFIDANNDGICDNLK